jgi:hypothetical protein
MKRNIASLLLAGLSMGASAMPSVPVEFPDSPKVGSKALAKRRAAFKAARKARKITRLHKKSRR